MIKSQSMIIFAFSMTENKYFCQTGEKTYFLKKSYTTTRKERQHATNQSQWFQSHTIVIAVFSPSQLFQSTLYLHCIQINVW